MPWTMSDYPSSLKNLDYTTKKKTIDIANAMIDEGYSEGRAIPIATAKAEEWKQNVSKKEEERYQENGQPEKRLKNEESSQNNPERLNEQEWVVPHQDDWAVKSENGKRPSDVFKNKTEAENRAKEIASNKGTKLKVKNQHNKK